MRVEVSGHKFSFPYQCACCGAAPQTTLAAVASRRTGKRVVYTNSKSWEFPYCLECVGHVRALRFAQGMTCFLVVVGCFGAMFLSSRESSGTVPAFEGIGIGIAVLFISYLLFAAAKGRCNCDCVCTKSAVAYFGWAGSCHSFEIASPDYAYSFMAENREKLVNVHPRTWEGLRQYGFDPSPHQPQSSKRYLERRDGNSFGVSLWLIIPLVLIFVAFFNFITRSPFASESQSRNDQSVERNPLPVTSRAGNAQSVSDDPPINIGAPPVVDPHPIQPAFQSQLPPVVPNGPTQMPGLNGGAGLTTEQFNDAVTSLKNKWEQMPEYFRRKCTAANTVPDLMRCIVQQQQDYLRLYPDASLVSNPWLYALEPPSH